MTHEDNNALSLQILVMPNGMTKRRNNSSQYRPKLDKIFWKLHIVFIVNSVFEVRELLKPDLDKHGEMVIWKNALVGVSLAAVDESLTIDSILDKVFDPDPTHVSQGLERQATTFNSHSNISALHIVPIICHLLSSKTSIAPSHIFVMSPTLLDAIGP